MNKKMGDDPPFLPVGTDVSAKYKGAFCEAKVKKVVRNIKCRLTLKAGGGTLTVNDDVIKGTLRVGSTVEVKQDPKKDAMEAIITKIQDCSQYTVVFDDGDITTLRRTALCLKSGRHFNESETLDQLPLTHPEHFSTPVIAGRRGRRGRAQSEESDGEDRTRRVKENSAEREPHVGRVVLVEVAGGAERRRPHQPAFPALVVAPTGQIKVKEDYLVRSFKDGRYYTVPKKEAREFRKGSAPTEWAGVDAALQYLNNGVLPTHWDRDALFNEPRNTSDDSSDDEPREEKDHFVAQLYKFMDDRGTPLNRNPTIANKDIDLYRLFRVVQKLGGYNRVTNQNQWKTIAGKMGFHPVTTSITNLCKQAYKKFLHSFEDFYRKLGVTLVAHPRGARTPPAGRSLIRDRDKQPPSSSASSTPTPGQRIKDKDSDKSETEKSEKSEKEDKPEKSKIRGSDEDDSADNQPLIVAAPKIEKEKEKEPEKKEKDKEPEKKEKDKEPERKEKDKEPEKKEKDKDKEVDKKEKETVKEKEKIKSGTSTPSDEKIVIKPRSQSKTRSLPPVKIEHEKRTPKRRPLSSKPGDGPMSSPRASRRPQVSTDSDSSGRASRCGPTKKMQCRRSQSANSASSGNTIASNSSKRPRKRKTTEPSTSEPTRAGASLKAQVGDKLKVYYGPTQSETKVTYEAKVIEISPEGTLRVHYTGWNTRYDEWIKPQRIALNVTQYEARNKKGGGMNRRVRSKRIEESSARSDSDSSDTDDNVKRPPNKLDDKSLSKTPRSKDAKSSDSSSSSKPRKRPIRSVTTPSNVSSPKKLRHSAPGHQGRDYDLNEIRSELKGLHTVKQEPDDVKQEPVEKESLPSTSQSPPEPQQLEKQPEDVYEFKEPEPFELELHDEKKKRTHRIFDDISPSKYTSTLSKSLSEEISEDPLRPRPPIMSPSMSPFRDFGSTREAPGRQSPEDDKDDIFSMDDDSFPGDCSGHIFEGFTPAKNQETYSKKSKVSKLRQLIDDDSPDSPADDEQSSEDEPEVVSIKEPERVPTPEQVVEAKTVTTSPEIKPKEEKLEPDQEKADSPKDVAPKELPKMVMPEPIITTPIKKIDVPTIKLSPVIKPITVTKLTPITKPMPITITKPTPDPKPAPKPSTSIAAIIKSPVMEPKTESTKSPQKKEELGKMIPIPSAEPILITKPLETTPTKLEPPSSPMDIEEDKSEPDSPARIDVLPEPPPAFLLQSEGPKIAEKLLKAINSAKRLSMSPPPVTSDRPITPRKDSPKPKPEEKISPTIEARKLPPKSPAKLEPVKKSPLTTTDSIFGEPSKMTDLKCEDAKKVKPKESSPGRLLSPLNILERRMSGTGELTLGGPGKNKVLSDTIQKLSSQINQTAAVASIALPPFPNEEKSESSDSDEEDRRLIIDKLTFEEWGSGGSSEASRPPAAVRSLHAGKSPGEWSAGESLLMLEDACKNERKHSASVVVAGGSRAHEEDSNISLLLCSETIPGSPAPADPPPAPLPFASASQHHHAKENRDAPAPVEPGPAQEHVEDPARVRPGRAERADRGERAERREGSAWIDNTPPTTPDSSLDMSPHRERRISERDSPSERKEDEENRPIDAVAREIEKPLGARSRKASCSSVRGRPRRVRRDTDDTQPPPPPLKYNFYVDLDPSWDPPTRIKILTSRLADLRKAYHNVKADLAAIDRRRKKLRRKEREAVKAAKAACA